MLFNKLFIISLNHIEVKVVNIYIEVNVFLITWIMKMSHVIQSGEEIRGAACAPSSPPKLLPLREYYGFSPIWEFLCFHVKHVHWLVMNFHQLLAKMNIYVGQY